MSKVFIEETTLTAIGDAIREKTGSTGLIAPGNMPTEIKSIVSGGGSGDGDCNGLHIPEKALTLTGNCSYRFANDGGWDWFIEECGDRITTNNIYMSHYMFNGCKVKEIPFEINFSPTFTMSQAQNMFDSCSNLVDTGLPKINNLRCYSRVDMFKNCGSLVHFPSGFINDTWTWDKITGENGMFNQCYKLRTVPTDILVSHMNSSTGSGHVHYNLFNYCYSLESVMFPVNTSQTLTGDTFYNTFMKCYRLKDVRFELQEDGTPHTANWTRQVIDLTSAGYGASSGLGLMGLSNSTKVDNSLENWKGYVNRENLGTCLYPDGWASDFGWATFSLTAACRLIETLPDTSTYLASAGGTNTIKFKGTAGMSIRTNSPDYNVDSEKISDMPEEIIALAAVKGWTVTLA